MVTAGTALPVALFDNYWAPTLAFARSLGRQGVPLHVYGAGAARWSRYASRRLSCPPVDDADRFLPWLRERVRSGEITRIAPTTDLLAFYASMLREEFPEEVQRTIAPLEETERALIKPRFTHACLDIGQPVPLTRWPASLEEAIVAGRELGYPLMLKPKSHLAVGTAERGGLVHNEAQLREQFARYEPRPGQLSLAERYPELLWPLLQRYVPSARRQVYSVTGFKDRDNGIITAAVSCKRQQWPPDVGTSVAQIGLHDEAILQAGLRTADQLVSCGIFELELLAEQSQWLAIDLNPRAYGFIRLDIERGHDLPWLWMQSTTAPLTPIAPPDVPVALEARHLLLYFLKRLAEWRQDARDTRTPDRRDPAKPRGWISMMGDPHDPVPAILSHAFMLRHPRSLIRSHFRARSELACERSSEQADSTSVK